MTNQQIAAIVFSFKLIFNSNRSWIISDAEEILVWLNQKDKEVFDKIKEYNNG